MGLFSILPIVQEHYRSLVSDSSRLRTATIFGFIPGITGIVLSLSGILLTPEFTRIVISMLAILVGFSINALVLLMRDHEAIKDGTREAELMENTRNHTMYALIFGLTILTYTGGIMLFQTSGIDLGYLADIVGSSILFAGLVHYLQTLYLLPARLYAIIDTLFR